MFREGTTGQHRHAIGVSVRVPASGYGAEIPEVEAATGGEARLIVRVENRSARAETLELTVEGVPAGWAEVHPRTVTVEAGAQREADVIVHVPRAPDVNAAEWPLRVVAHSHGGRRVGSAPARMRVTPYAVLSLELHPAELRARRRASAEVRVVNSGTAAADVELSASGGRVTPEQVRVEPGGQATARLEVRTSRRWLSHGEPQRLVVEAPGAKAHGSFQQRPSLPRWLVLVPVLAAAVGTWLASRPHEISVPRVTGLSVPEARERLREAGLTPRQAPLPATDTSTQPGVVNQDPPPGEEIADGGDVTITYYKGEGVGQVTPKVGASSVAPPEGESAPVAYVRANRVFVTFPGEAEEPVGGTVGEQISDPAWNPRTGELVYVRRASPEAGAEIVAVDPHTPGTGRPLTAGDGSYISPAFSPDGNRLAVIEEDGSGYGGRLCLVVPPATAPRCHADPGWRYDRPAWGGDGALYVLRRAAANTRDGGWDELVRVRADLVPESNALVSGDLRSVAVARDDRLAVIARRPGESDYHVEVLSQSGDPAAVQSVGGGACEVAWSGAELLVSRGSCDGQGVGEIVRLDPGNLDAGAAIMTAGEDPAVPG